MRLAPVLALLLLGCDGTAAPRPAGPGAAPPGPDPGAALVAQAASPQGIVGRYSASQDLELFRPCGTDESWWPTGGDLAGMYEAVVTQSLTPVFARIRGHASPLGHYGHFNAYEREIDVDAVLEMRPLAAGDCE